MDITLYYNSFHLKRNFLYEAILLSSFGSPSSATVICPKRKYNDAQKLVFIFADRAQLSDIMEVWANDCM